MFHCRPVLMMHCMVHSTEQMGAAGLEVADGRSLRRLLDGVAALAKGMQHGTVLPHIVETAVDLVDARYGALGLYDRRTGACRPAVAAAAGRGLIDPATAPAAVHEVLRTVAHDTAPLRGQHFGTQPALAVLGVPIVVRAEVIGGVCLVEKCTAVGFSEVDEELVATLVAAAVPAIEVAGLQAGLRGWTRSRDAVQGS
jgi:two-component system sensor histidine kinase DevS